MEPLSESLEDYLEAIGRLVKEKHAARAKDVAERLGVKASSVTNALQTLAEKKLVNYAPYDLITLTESGTNRAQEIMRRHDVLKEFIGHTLGVPEAEAELAACRMEHAVSRNVIEKLVALLDDLAVCPRAGENLVKALSSGCARELNREACQRCLSSTQTKQTAGRPGSLLFLPELKPGQKARIVKMARKNALHQRILEMGFTTGSVLELVRTAPLGDPLEIKIKGYHIFMRKAEAAHIQVEPIG